METRETNGKALPSEAEMELRGQIEVHIEPPDNDTPTAGSKVSYNLVIFSFKKCAIKMGKGKAARGRQQCNLSKEANTIRVRTIGQYGSFQSSTFQLDTIHSGQKFDFGSHFVTFFQKHKNFRAKNQVNYR